MAGIVSVNAMARPTRRAVLRSAAGMTLGVALGGLGACTRNRGEANLVVYSAGPAWLAKAAAAHYEQTTGQVVELFSATTGQVMAKLQAERYNRRADVVVLASRLAAEHLKCEEQLQPYRPTDKATDDGDDPDGAYHTSSAAAVGLALRADLDVDPASLTWQALLTGGFDGRLVMPAPSRSGTAADFVLGFVQQRGESAWDLMLSAKKAGLEIGGANNQAIGGLLSGAYDAIFAAADYLIFKQVATGAPVRMHYPAEGVPLVHRPIAILRGCRVPDAARQFVDLYYDSAVQERAADGHLLPARADIPVSDARRAAGELNPWPMDIDLAMRDQAAVLRRFAYQIERAVL